MRGKDYCRRYRLAWIAGWIAVGWSGYAQAWNFPDVFQDPLSVEPPILQTGQRFPGGTEPIPCPSQVDLTRVLALGDAVDVALCNNAQLKEAWAEIKIQSGALGETWATFSPTLLIRPDLSVIHAAYFTRASWKNFFTRSGDFSNVCMCSVAAAFNLTLVRTGTLV